MPDVSTFKWAKIASVRIFGALTRADIRTVTVCGRIISSACGNRPAMAVGLANHLEEIILIADNYMPEPGKRDPYSKEIQLNDSARIRRCERRKNALTV
jgi:hypothetical protein